MKNLYLFFTLIFLSVGILFAENAEPINPFQAYLANPGTATFEQAHKHYISSLEDNADDDNTRLMLSYLYMMELERTLDQIDVQADSVAPNVAFNYANILLEMRRFEDAIEIYEMLNESYPSWSCPWRHKGEAYFKSGKLSEAETALEKAIETRVEHYDAYVMLAEVQEEMGSYKEALATLETGFTYYGKDIEDPDEEVSDIDTQFLYLRLLKKNKRTNEADALQEKLMKIAPDDERWKDVE
ncbi:MAG: tetratricopeptide repeat protein [Candidatus Cloacimonetes bacterium]|nr:tetratricopeptide repeat protein [Candidatus Cloacimonadota bacterium]